jgi:hypothetical protein
MNEEELKAYRNTMFSSRMLLEVYLHSIIPLMNEGAFAWNRVDKLLKERTDRLIADKKIFDEGLEMSIFEILLLYKLTIQKHKLMGNIKTIFTIADLLPHCNESEKRYLLMRKFLLDLFGELDSKLNKKEKELVRKTLFSVLTNFDNKYLNFVGEIAVLNLLLKNNYKLVGVEVKIPNAKPIDFKLHKPDSNRHFNIEVVNIHYDTNKLESEEKIEEFLIKRINQKLESKIQNIKIPAHFFLVPVLWGDIEGLRKIQAIFKREPKLLGKKTIEPCAFLSKRSSTEIFNFFGRITTLDLK